MFTSWLIGLHLLSFHVPNISNYETFTPGIYAKAPDGLTFGIYNNSYSKASIYAGWTFETPEKRFAIMVAGVSGYPRNNVTLLVTPSIKVDSFRISLIPKVEKYGASVIHVSFERGW